MTDFQKSPKRFRKIALLAIMGLVIVALLLFLNRKRTIVGIYTFRSSEVQETVEFAPDGRFMQKIVIGTQSYSATGNWSLVSHDVKLRGEFLVRFDTANGKLLNPPKTYSSYSGYWDGRNDQISLDPDYYATKYFLKRERGIP